MTTRVVVDLPDIVYERAVRFAQLTERDVDVVLSETLALSLPALHPHTESIISINDLDDDAVLELANLQLSPEQDLMLSTLLERQQAGNLAVDEQNMLADLMLVYQEGLLRKAQALAEAVRRGLRAPLAP